MNVNELYVWKSAWFLRGSPKNQGNVLRMLEKMHNRTWCKDVNWDSDEPQLLQLPGDDQFAVDGKIPYENLNKMIHISMHRLMKQWKKGYPFPDTYVGKHRRIPLMKFFLRGDHVLCNEKSYFCKFLALALADQAEVTTNDPYSEVKALLNLDRLYELNPNNTRLDSDYLHELRTEWMRSHPMPKNGWDFEPFKAFMRKYGITI